jgi:RNA polymerase sigma-70 factor (ECF subfamily)
VESDGLRFEDRVLARAELADALRRMDDRSRQVIVETVLRDRSSADVAAELGLPAGTVRSRSHYALRRLRELLGETQAPSFA